MPRSLNAGKYADARFGVPTVTDILKELTKPGCDPRPEFKTATFQDGLVHISAQAEKFVKDPRDVVKAGDVVRVKVLEVDEKRKRIALTMRLNDTATSQNRNETLQVARPLHGAAVSRAIRLRIEFPAQPQALVRLTGRKRLETRVNRRFLLPRHRMARWRQRLRN